LEALVAPETAGDPQSEQKWVRSSLRHLSARLRAGGHRASPPTIGRLLKSRDYALHVNAKKREASATHPQRNEQFAYIAAQRAAFTAAGWPIVSVDTKKKELIGNFRNAGRSWSRAAEAVNVHDFPQDALGRAVPYGIYDLQHNRGTVCVGQSGDTPRFAVTALTQWWVAEGRGAYAGADHLLILADSGGSNGWQPRRWKQQVQEQLSDRFGLTVTVCHYPTGCSKWNPIEHRLFGPITTNWAGQPLRTWATLLSYLRGTQTCTGLTVRAHLDHQQYPTGETVSDAEMAALQLERHAVCPRWNYTIRPRQRAVGTADATVSRRELNS
jgi:hypothetical protein